MLLPPLWLRLSQTTVFLTHYDDKHKLKLMCGAGNFRWFVYDEGAIMFQPISIPVGLLHDKPMDVIMRMRRVCARLESRSEETNLPVSECVSPETR